MLRFANESAAQVDDVTLRIRTDSELVSFLEGTSRLYTSKTPDGAKLSDNLPARGINIGSYASGGVAYVLASIQVGGAESVACGTTTTVLEVHLRVGEATRREDLAVRVQRRC